jgi:hypothetical protein
MALACLRYKLPAVHGRGFDSLPQALAVQFEGSLITGLDLKNMWRAFSVAVRLLLAEIQSCNPELAIRLHEPLEQLCLASLHSSDLA